MNLTDEQRAELERVARHGQPAYVRTKALVLLNRAEGRTVSELARLFQVSRQAIYDCQRRYERAGIQSLWVQPGRGRKGRADPKEIERYVRQSPRNFGVARTRWTLQSLAAVVPSLRGFSPFGVQKALARVGYRYKRGQPHVHSPDPQYEIKKGLWTRL
jgi:transposase